MKWQSCRVAAGVRDWQLQRGKREEGAREPGVEWSGLDRRGGAAAGVRAGRGQSGKKTSTSVTGGWSPHDFTVPYLPGMVLLVQVEAEFRTHGDAHLAQARPPSPLDLSTQH